MRSPNSPHSDGLLPSVAQCAGSSYRRYTVAPPVAALRYRSLVLSARAYTSARIPGIRSADSRMAFVRLDVVCCLPDSMGIGSDPYFTIPHLLRHSHLFQLFDFHNALG